MIVHHDGFLVNKTTNAPSSIFIGITTLHVSGSLSAHHQELQLYIGVGTIYVVLVTEWYQAWDGIPHLVPLNHQNCINCTNANVRPKLLMIGRKTAQNM
jgi:hypothetical protein